MIVCPRRMRTRLPVAGTLPPLQVEGADHGPLCAELTKRGFSSAARAELPETEPSNTKIRIAEARSERLHALPDNIMTSWERKAAWHDQESGFTDCTMDQYPFGISSQ